MNRGTIPGYYYDEEKKKYFKIQANHVAPSNAKYNRTNVKREQREVKKRRIEANHERALHAQTVPEAKLLKSSLLGGSGLRREHGDRPLASYHSRRDEAFVQGLHRQEICLQLSGFAPERTRFTDLLRMQDRSQILMSVAHGAHSFAVYAKDHAVESDWEPFHTFEQDHPLTAFHDSVDLEYGNGVVVAYAASNDLFGGNVVIADLNAQFESDKIHRVHVGGEDATLWDCKINTRGGHNKIAFAKSNGIEVHFTTRIGPVSHADCPPLGPIESFALDWLSDSTFAVGTRRLKDKLSRQAEILHEVHLCDLRSGGVASRLERRDRITGIHNPNHSGTRLIVSSSRQISLYDLRVLRPDSPLLSLNHTSGTTKLHIPTHGELLAAIDYDNKIQIYSLRTGQHLRTFSAPAARGLLQRPRWEEDWRGVPYLQACAMNTLQRWTWHQPADYITIPRQ